jgi:site-specific recombinase XerD
MQRSLQICQVPLCFVCLYNLRAAKADKNVKERKSMAMTKDQILEKLKTDLEARGRHEVTVKNYVRIAEEFQDHFRKPADQMGESDIMKYQHYLLKEKKNQRSTVNTCNSALRFLFAVTLDRPLNIKKIPRLKQTRRLPQLFSKEEVAIIICSAKTMKEKSMLMLAYGSGLRLSEVTNLKIKDIESDKMRILVRHGKGDRDRYAILPEVTLKTLREYWKAYRPKEWLFESPITGRNYHKKTLQDAFKFALKSSGISKHGSFHMLRYCFATHLYEEIRDLLALQKLMGHLRIDTTAWYTQMADSGVLRIKSPLDTMREHLDD